MIPVWGRKRGGWIELCRWRGLGFNRLQYFKIFQKDGLNCRWRGLDFNRLQYFKIFPPPRHKLLSWPFWTVRGRRCRHSRKLSNRFVARDDIIRFVLKAKDDLLQGIRYCKVGKHSIDRAARAPQQPTKMAGKAHMCPRKYILGQKGHFLGQTS